MSKKRLPPMLLRMPGEGRTITTREDVRLVVDDLTGDQQIKKVLELFGRLKKGERVTSVVITFEKVEYAP